MITMQRKQTKMQKTIAGKNIYPVKLPPPRHSLSLFRYSLLSPLLIFALIFSGVVSYISSFCYVTTLFIYHRFLTGDFIPLPAEIGIECDIFSGRWVRDYDRPLYIGGQLTCLEHGRPEKDYRYWRWQPYYCSLPSFNATLMLEELRGKRMIFVGDSLNRGQFTSLVCLLQRVIPQNAQSMETIDSLTVFTAKDYNARIEYYWMPFLVSNADDPGFTDRVIRNAPIGKHGQHWIAADIILFNTYTQGVKILLSGSLDDEVKHTVNVTMEEGYRIAINKLIKWVNHNINPNKTRLFFVGFSATHNCYRPYQSLSSSSITKKKGEKLPFAVGEAAESGGGCDLFRGRWVWDDDRPLYEESECPYIQPQLTCQEHGRPDTDYQHWRWQPHGCSLPRFNATLMLETLRHKRMMFVGDSLNRGQFVSMVCLVHKILPDDAKSMTTNGSLTVFRAKDYNATIEFYWAPFLLESNCDDAIVHRISDRLVRKGSIIKHGKHWKGVDIMVFNTYLWWITGPKFKILQESFEDEEKDIVEVPTEEAYRMAMKSMLRWVKRNMDPNKTRVFFTSMSPSHQKSIDWGGNAEGNCYNQTSMIEDPNYWGSDTKKSVMSVIGEVFGKSRVPITFLNITQLSSYRKDAHTSIYKKQWSPLTPEQLANPMSYADCVHWCLPGLQDTWNELLFAKLFYP